MNRLLTVDKQSYLVAIILIRWLMAAMFVESFIDKVFHWDIYLSETTAKGIPFAELALGLAATTELLGSLSLIFNRWLKAGALILAGYVFVLGFFYFNFWDKTGLDAVMARKEFLKDLAVVAGLLFFVILPNNTQSLIKETS